MIFFNELVDIIYLIPILLFSVALHESSHARVAYYLGDKSQTFQGRMTLDPFAHFDLFGFISILLIGIGWGKPALIDDRYFKNKKRDKMLVSLAGPLSNLLLALVITIILKIFIMFGFYEFFLTSNIGKIIYNFLSMAVIFNIVFAVFNMLPIPPFDGSKVVAYFLPYNIKQKYLELERYSIYIILIMFLLNIDTLVMTPAVNFIINILNSILTL